MPTELPGRMRTGASLGRTLYLLNPGDDLAANPKAGKFIGTVDTPELAEAICAAVNAVHAIRAECTGILTGADPGDFGNGQVAMASRVLEILGE